MKASIKDRALLVAPAAMASAPTTPSAVNLEKSGPGSMVAFMAKESKAIQEHEALKAKWDGATPAQMLDAKLIKPSKWANRHEESFSGKEWDAFKEELSHAGGNIQPIKVRGVRPTDTPPAGSETEGVRPTDTPIHLYEIVFGHRRHRACLELGLPVFALVEDATDVELFEAMDRENRQREDLTVYEQGEMYRRALDGGLYPSIRKLAESLGVGLGSAADAVKIARLPEKVLDAFESRLDIQLRWAGPLAAALQKDPDAVLAEAACIQAERATGEVVKSAEVFKRLIVVEIFDVVPTKRPVALPGGAKMKVSGAGSKMKVELTGLDSAAVARVEAAIVKALKGESGL